MNIWVEHKASPHTCSFHMDIGVTGLIKGKMLKEGAAVIDVGKAPDRGFVFNQYNAYAHAFCVPNAGITRVPSTQGKSRLIGDVDFESVSQVAGILTPVPGGVGPMTVAMLMKNTLQAAQNKYTS